MPMIKALAHLEVEADVHDALISTLTGMESIRIQYELVEVMNFAVPHEVGRKLAENETRRVTKESVYNHMFVEDVVAKA